MAECARPDGAHGRWHDRRRPGGESAHRGPAAIGVYCGGAESCTEGRTYLPLCVRLSGAVDAALLVIVSCLPEELFRRRRPRARSGDRRSGGDGLSAISSTWRRDGCARPPGPPRATAGTEEAPRSVTMPKRVFRFATPRILDSALRSARRHASLGSTSSARSRCAG